MDILAKPIHSGFVLTPTIIAGGITGFTLAGGGKTLTVPLDASVSGTNTGDNAANTSVASKALDNLASVAMNASLRFNNSSAFTFDIASTANTVVGCALTISAGSTVTGGTADMAGGNLTLNSGLGKGTGASSIIFQTGRTLTTGSTLQTLTTAMTILGSGNVGIGTTNPGYLLDVNGIANFTTAIRVGATPATTGAIRMTDGDAIRSAGQLSFRSGGGAGKGVLYEFGADAALSVGSPQTFMQIAGTFNNASYLRTGLLVSMTNTASAVNSKLFDVQLAGVSQFNVDVNGSVGIGTTAPTISGTGKFDMNADTFRLRTARTPASAAAAGNAGEICWDANYLYVAVNTNTWVRTPILTWV